MRFIWTTPLFVSAAGSSDTGSLLQHASLFKSSVARGVEEPLEVQRAVASASLLSQVVALDKVLLPEPEFGAIGGRCLDGSMSGYYYGAPSSGDSSLWVIFLEGGGYCTNEADCNSRSKGKRGSSNQWPATLSGSDGSDILSKDASTNPDFHDAHHVYVPYCTGDVHSGQVTIPTEEQWGLYFSGHLNFKGILQHLQATKPAAANMQRVLLSGQSAGGIGTLYNCDFLQSFLHDQGSAAAVSCAPIAGWFFPGSTEDHEDPDVMPSAWPYWSVGTPGPGPDNATAELWQARRPTECVEARGSDGWKCDSAHTMYPYIKAPTYVIENQYDTNQLFAQLQLPKTEASTNHGQEYIAYFGQAMKNSTQLVVEHPLGKTGDGLFLPSCFDHVGGIKFGDSAQLSGFTSFDGVADWFFGRGTVPTILIDDCELSPGLPCNPTCKSLR